MLKKERNILLLILGFMAALGPFSIDMYLPSFSAIAKDLDTDIAKVSLTLTSYFIGISVGQLIYGPIIDRYGRIKPLLIGLVIFVIASVGCALSPDIYSLIILRLFLALGGCVGMVASRAIIRDRFDDEDIPKAFSSLILVMGVAPIIAPSIGGYISSTLGWQYIFYVLAIIGILLILVVKLFLKESKKKDLGVSLNLKKVSISYYKVLSHPEFLFNGIAGSLVMAGMFAYIAGSPFVFMELFGMEESAYGWMFGLNAVAFIGGSQINRLLLIKFRSPGLTYYISMLSMLFSIITLFVIFAFDLPLFLIQIFLFVFMLLSGIISPNTSAMAVMPFTKNAGVASALIGSLRMATGAIASVAISIFHNGSYFPMILIIIFCSIIAFLILARKRFGKRKKKIGLQGAI